jgi:hypothetical protein
VALNEQIADERLGFELRLEQLEKQLRGARPVSLVRTK